jgi:hypothetical protein
VLEAGKQAVLPVRFAIGVARLGSHPHFAAAYLYFRRGQIVRPQVKAAAARDIKACVVPVTGQDAVRDRPAVQRKAEMRASIVDREAARSLADHEERATGALDDGHPSRFEILEAACVYPGVFSVSIGSAHGR